jgi:hypothetical protein
MRRPVSMTKTPGYRYAATFFLVQDSPLANHPPVDIAQDRKGKTPLLSDRLGHNRRINGHRSQSSASANLGINIAILGQLAETKRSPVPAIEQEHERTGPDL